MINPEEFFADADEAFQSGYINKAFDKYQQQFKKLQKITGLNSTIHKDLFVEKEADIMAKGKELLRESIEEHETAVPLKVFERMELFHMPKSCYRNDQMLIDILNNQACCHRRLGSSDQAIDILKRALTIAKAHDINAGVTYTNLSAVYSQKKLTKVALKISQQAISELYPLMLKNKTPENIKLLAIAYYNLASQQSQMKDYQGAMINCQRGITLLKEEEYPADDAVLRKLQQCYKQTRSKFNKQKIQSGKGRSRSRPASASQRPESSRRTQRSNNMMSQSNLSNSKVSNFSSMSKNGLYSRQRQRSGSFKPMTYKVNPSLVHFQNIQWRKSDEYTHNNDMVYKDRIHLHSNIKPKRLGAYMKENPKYEGGNNNSMLNKSKNRRLFDGSNASVSKSKANNSKLSVQKGYKTKEDDYLYQVNDKKINNYLRQLPKSRNKVYHLEDDEKDLLDDSWKDSDDSGSEEEYNMPVRNRYSSQKDDRRGNDKSQMRRNQVKFFHSLKKYGPEEEIDSRDQQEEQYDQYPANNNDLDDWDRTPDQNTIAFRPNTINPESRPQSRQNSSRIQRPGTSQGDRGRTAGGLRYRTLDEKTLKKKRDLEERRKELKSPKVNYITSSDLRNSNREDDDENDITSSLIIQNRVLQRKNESLQRALEEERSKNRIKELQEERENYMRERDRSAKLIQNGWKKNSLKRSEKRRIEGLQKYGFKLVKKCWTSIPQETGGFCPSKVMVFENSSTSTLTVIAENVRNNQTKNLEIQVEEDHHIESSSLDQNLYITRSGQLEVKNIDVHEVSLSRQNTEEPLIDKEVEESFDRNQLESPLFPTEKSQTMKSEYETLDEGQLVDDNLEEQEVELLAENTSKDLDAEPTEEGLFDDNVNDLEESNGVIMEESKSIKNSPTIKPISNKLPISEEDLDNFGPEEDSEGEKELVEEEKTPQLTADEIKAKKAVGLALLGKKNNAARLIQNYHIHGSKARARAKEQIFKRVVPLRDHKFMVSIKDSKEVDGAKIVQCYGITKWKNYKNVEVSPYLVDKISKNGDSDSLHESIFNQIDLTWDEMKLKNQSPRGDPIEIDQFDDIDEVNEMSMDGLEDDNLDMDLDLDGVEDEEQEEPLLNVEQEELAKHQQSLLEEDDLLIDNDSEGGLDNLDGSNNDEEPLIEDSNIDDDNDQNKSGSFFSDGMKMDSNNSDIQIGQELPIMKIENEVDHSSVNLVEEDAIEGMQLEEDNIAKGEAQTEQEQVENQLNAQPEQEKLEVDNGAKNLQPMGPSINSIPTDKRITLTSTGTIQRGESNLSMQNKMLDEEEAAVNSADGDINLIPEGSEIQEEGSEETPNLNIRIEPFNISNLRDKRGKKFQVVFRETESHVQIEVHKPNSTYDNPDDLVNYRIMMKNLFEEKDLSSDDLQRKWVNAGMRCLCQSSNNNYSLSEIEKFLNTTIFDEVIDFQFN